MRSPQRKRRFTGHAVIALLCVALAIWGAFKLFSVEQPLESLLDNFMEFEIVPAHTADQKITQEHELTTVITIK